jgi:hypothetical protein
MCATRPYWCGSLAALLAAFAGCNEELGPVRFATTRVTGEVREGGRPVAGGWIEFIPIEGTVGNLRSAPIGADGRFAVTGVAVGRNAISLVNAPARWPETRQLLRSHGGPIRRDIPPGAARLELDLLTEAIRYEKLRRERVTTRTEAERPR